MMKKLILLGAVAFGLAGCSSSISDSNQLIGTWRCTINYNDFNIRTIDDMRFAANGSVSSQGTINYPMQKPIFVYSSQTHGRWTLNNNRLVYRVLSESVKRNHSDAIWAELERDASLQQYEESLFGTLSDIDSYKVIEFTITDFRGDEMAIKQELKGQGAYNGQCVKQ